MFTRNYVSFILNLFPLTKMIPLYHILEVGRGTFIKCKHTFKKNT